MIVGIAQGLPSAPAVAASFGCARASNPFERAICHHSVLSAVDEILAKTHATAIGGRSMSPRR
ncbi:MAG: hypothetical protein ABS75_28590 [Pelagibacterium sp. SCN 63-23]|nr:MAG: hypothetical protein ABS75_28590 [Pelagibacterium sp. SCN 63-23]